MRKAIRYHDEWVWFKMKDIVIYKRTSKNIKVDCDCCERRCKYVITFRKRMITLNLCVRHRRRLRRLLSIPSEIPTQEAFLKANIAKQKRKVGKHRR